jgi:hypothetical protein
LFFQGCITVGLHTGDDKAIAIKIKENNYKE